MSYNKAFDRYEIRKVIGPDEFHEGIHNNAYTNMMAAWNLRCTKELCTELRRIFPRTAERLFATLSLTDEEIADWGEVAENIYIPRSSSSALLLEAHEGYFQKEDVALEKDERSSFPIFPRRIPRPIRLQRTQLVKQADTILLFHLFSERFSEQEKIVNFDYYEPRTIHSSSLSCSIYSIVAAAIGRVADAYRYFRHSAMIDLANLYSGAAGGIRIGACGGTWQAIIFGFAGLRICGKKFLLEPRLPLHWDMLSFKIKWQGAIFVCTLTREEEVVKISIIKGS